MWTAECFEKNRIHIEENVLDRIINRDAKYYNENLTPEELKQKILGLIQTCSNIYKELGIDRETNLPKYWILKKLPGSQIYVKLLIIEDKKEKIRKLKTVATNLDDLSPKI